MGQSQSAEVLVSRAPASAQLPSGGEPAPCRPAWPRKVSSLVDSLNVGGTKVQAVELATRLNPERYDVTLGCLRVRGPLLERRQGSRIVFPSQAEGLPSGVLECLAAGLPPIASQVGGNVEIIQDGKTGLLVPPEDSTALAGTILPMLGGPGLAGELGRNGRADVAAEFNFRRRIEKTDPMYTELLHSRGAE